MSFSSFSSSFVIYIYIYIDPLCLYYRPFIVSVFWNYVQPTIEVEQNFRYMLSTSYTLFYVVYLIY
ncbi:hypothetical protein J3Q64DRAFT_1729510 [Phycomyces blakesleeanus]|uniref:Uncharacterized protein n=1 Tax=Phycomyces blakesleeanus TaxID=4837 RepID=A0ABR3B549_PHYBL